MPETDTDLNQTIEHAVGIIRRRRWWILLIASAVAIGEIGVLSQLPDRYRSEATLLVVGQRVPERYVVPTTTSDVSEALQTMTHGVLSRSRLIGIIDEFGLYAQERKSMAPEEVVELMRKDIDLQPFQANPERRNFNAFRIAYTSTKPHVAQQVTARLTSLFITENLRTREQQAASTTRFLEQQLDAAKSKLMGQEQRLRDFKMQHLGDLPEQRQGNLAIYAGLQAQLQNNAAALSRAQEQRVYLESLLNQYRNLSDTQNRLAELSSAPAAGSPLDVARTELAGLRAERRRLLGAYKPEHPDVVRVEGEIAKAAALEEQLQQAQGKSGKGATIATREAGNEAAVAQVRSQIESNRLEIENLSRDQKRLQAAAAAYENRLDQTPVREQQLAGIQRDYDLLRQDYADLLAKRLQAGLATRLEEEQGGQQFRIADPPSLPTVPTSPNRRKFGAVGLVAGLFLGLGAAMLIEVRDRSIHSEESLRESTGIPLVIGIPRLLTSSERHSRHLRRILEWAGGSALILAVSIAEYTVFRLG